MLTRKQQIDGVVVWDMVCGTVGRPCPKLTEGAERLTSVAHFTVPPTCIYVLPKSLPELPATPASYAQALNEVELLKALHICFGGKDSEVNYVDFDIELHTGNLKRRTKVRRDGAVVKESNLTFIRRA